MASNDFLDVDPQAFKSRPKDRKERILNLVEVLLQQSNANAAFGYDKDKEFPIFDDSHQTTGADAFVKFEKQIRNADQELRNFSNAASQLGSSAAILSSAFSLRTRFAHILFLYRENATDLFPRQFSRRARSQRSNRFRRSYHSSTKQELPHYARPMVPEDLDVNEFPEQFEALADEITKFADSLNEFPQFTHEDISSFEDDLKYWASCLKVYEGQFKNPAVQRYIHDLAVELGDHIDSFATTLSNFIEVDVPTIRFAQRHEVSNLFNVSTVATFFSAVTASTLQFSYTFIDNASGVGVNSFWFLSLVLSIGAVVNSLLGLTWKQAMYSSPGHRVPSWFLIWLKRSPLVFLVMSVACFSVGLCLFAYASSQNPVTSIITSVFTGFTSLGLASASAWFAFERWAFTHHRGRKWLGDILLEISEQILQLSGITSLRLALRWTWRRCRRIGSRLGMELQSLKSLFMRVTLTTIHKRPRREAEINGLPTIVTTRPGYDPNAPGSPMTPFSPTTVTPAISSHIAASFVVPDANSKLLFNAAPPSKGKQLWMNAMQAVKLQSVASLHSALLDPTVQPRSRAASLSASEFEHATVLMMQSHVSKLSPKLRRLKITQDLPAHQGLVRHMQFSPDGKFLASSGWDRTCVIFRVGDPFKSHRVLAQPNGFVGQVAWSPDSQILLTRSPRCIKVWSQIGVCMRTINRYTSTDSIAWCPDGEAFLSVEGSDVVKLDLKGNVLDTYSFDNMKLDDVAVTPDGNRLLGVGSLTESPTGLQPSKARTERRLVVYNTQSRQVENITPVLNDIQQITLAANTRNGPIVLVSYANKVPPQSWKLVLAKNLEGPGAGARLTLRHNYLPKTPVDFVGRAYFGGKNDDLVLCAGSAGEILIWHLEHGTLLHRIEPQTVAGEVTCLAWNPAAGDKFMFATGSHHGGVQIWTRLTDEMDDTSFRNLAGPQSDFGFEGSESGFESDFQFTESHGRSEADEGSVLESVDESQEHTPVVSRMGKAWQDAPSAEPPEPSEGNRAGQEMPATLASRPSESDVLQSVRKVPSRGTRNVTFAEPPDDVESESGLSSA